MSQTHVPPAIAKIAPDGNLTPRQKRRFMIEMVKRRIKPGAGSAVEFLQRRTALNPWPDLRPMLKGLKWALVGGVATRAYMPERVTKDLDVLVQHTNQHEVMERFKQAGYVVVSELIVPGYLLRSPEGVEVDVIFGDYPWLKKALAHPQPDMAGYPVIGLPYLVLMKLTAERAQAWADVSRMLGWASDKALNEVRAVIKRHSPEDLEDLESLIFLGQKSASNHRQGCESDSISRW